MRGWKGQKGTPDAYSVADAYAVSRGLLKQRDLPDLKRSEFKAVVAPLIKEQHGLGLRNDLPALNGED